MNILVVLAWQPKENESKYEKNDNKINGVYSLAVK